MVLLSVGGSAAQAQPDGFDARLEAALAAGGEGVGLLRCAGLFRSFRLYAGDDTELGASAAEREEHFAVFAMLSWQNEVGAAAGADVEDVLDATVPLIDAATELYLERLVENLRLTGTVLDDDLERSIAFCNLLRDRILEAAE